MYYTIFTTNSVLLTPKVIRQKKTLQLFVPLCSSRQFAPDGIDNTNVFFEIPLLVPKRMGSLT